MVKKKIFHRKKSKKFFWEHVLWFNSNLLNGRGIRVLHAGKYGRILRKDETSWKTISGIVILTTNTQTFAYFRRRRLTNIVYVSQLRDGR